MNNTVDLRFADDSPSAVDEFEAGPHLRIAQTLVDIVCGSDGGHAIGLEGTWGSGKSTVVTIATKKLEESHQKGHTAHKVFTFDVWAHQGDPIRRSFLEELIGFLARERVLDANRWSRDLARIQARIKQTTTTNSPRLNWLTKAAIIAAPLIPLAYIWLSPLAFQNITSLDQVRPWTWLALLVVSSMYLLLAIAWIRNKFGKTRYSGSLLSLWDRSSSETVTEQFTRDEEPTTIEFNEIFDKIVNEVSQKGKKLVIVLDNLDRLPPDLVRSVWATMRNFFASAPGSIREHILKNIWLIVPFDRAYMEEVFYQKNRESSGDSQEPSHTEDISSRPTRGFIEKTFYVILRVSPPLLTDWRQYLNKHLSLSLGTTIAEQQKYQLFKLLEFHFLAYATPVTPRAIKTFVNGLVTQYRQWGDQIPLQFQALYLLNRDKISVNIRSLREAGLLDERTAAFVGPTEWPKYLAAAHYNVDPERALEVLLASDIERGLIAGDKEGLIRLQANPGFELALINLLEDKSSQWAKEEPRSFAEVCCSLSELPLKDTEIQENCWRNLANASSVLSDWTTFSERAERGIAALIENTNDHNVHTTTRAVVNSLARTTAHKPYATQFSGDWVRMLNLASAALKGKQGVDSKKIFSNILIPGDAAFNIGVASACAYSKNISISKSLLPSVDQSELTKRIIELISAETVAEDLRSAITSISNSEWTIDWDQIVNAIQVRLQTNTPPTVPNGAYILLDCLRIILFYKKEEHSKQALLLMADNGTLLGIFEKGRQESNPDLMALSLWCLIRKHGDAVPPNPGTHRAYGNITTATAEYNKIRTEPDNYSELVKKIAEFVAIDGELTRILKAAISDNPANSLFKSVLRQVVVDEKYDKLVVSDVFENYDKLAELLGSELENRFLHSFDRWADHIEKPLSDQKIHTLSLRFVQKSIELNTKIGKKALRIANDFFKRLGKEQWEKSLKEESDDLRLLIDLISLEASPKLAGSFKEALRGVTEEIIEGKFSPTRFGSSWNLLPDALQANSRTAFFKDIFTLITTRALGAESIRNVLKFVDPNFTNQAPLIEESSKTVNALLVPLFGEGHADGITWIESNLSILRECLGQAGSAERELLSVTVQALIDRSAEDKERIVKIAHELKLPISTEKK